MSEERFDFELDHEVGIGPVTCHGGAPVLLEYFRSSGAASIVDREVATKRRKRGLCGSEMVQSILALWACGGEPCEDFEHLRGGDGLSLLLGHDLPAPQTARDFLATFDEVDLPLLGGGKSAVREEGRGLRGLCLANRALIGDLQGRAPERLATIDIDATILASSKRAASVDDHVARRPLLAPDMGPKVKRIVQVSRTEIDPKDGLLAKESVPVGFSAGAGFFHLRRPDR